MFIKLFFTILLSVLATTNGFSQNATTDSLATNKDGAPVVINKDTLFVIYENMGAMSAYERAARVAEMINELGNERKNDADSLYLLDIDNVTEIMARSKIVFTVIDKDTIRGGAPRAVLATNYKDKISSTIATLNSNYTYLQIVKRGLLFLLVIVIQYFFIKLMGYFYRKLKVRISTFATTKLKSLAIRDYEFLNVERQSAILIWVINICRYMLIGFSLIITVPILFSIFPQTEHIARTIFSYILAPIKSISISVLAYIPNVFIIVIIYLSVHYIVKGLKYMANEIEREKLKITGFFPDWAQPTYNIIRFMLYAFMIAMIYPYLPGAESEIFKGISVFIGLIVSLGSTTVIGNIMSGLVITYMRPFKIGDRIKLNDTIGNVMEKTPFVTRILTPKNEIITIPNSFVLSSHTTNYSASARNFGLIIHSEVTIGYDAPWRKVHELLIEAALATEGVSNEPKPFVLETALSDFYPVYQINAYIQDANKLAGIYSELHQNIQDKFNEAGVEIMSPHYRAERNGDKTTIPEEY